MAHQAAQEVLRLENLQKSFGSVRALKSASFSLHEGEVVALLGDNGAGKSTLIKSISGVHPPDGGRIYARRAGDDPLGARRDRARHRDDPPGHVSAPDLPSPAICSSAASR